MAKRKRRAFTRECKAQAVPIVRESGQSVAAMAREPDLTETALQAARGFTPSWRTAAAARVGNAWRAGRGAAFLVWLVATLGVAAGLAWAGHRIRVLLHESRAGNAGG
jgi:hypothetical protein